MEMDKGFEKPGHEKHDAKKRLVFLILKMDKSCENLDCGKESPNKDNLFEK